MPARRRRPELILLVALFGLFAVGLLYFEQVGQRVTRADTPSSFNAQPQGVKALYLLLEQQGFRVSRLQTVWSGLTSGDGLAIMAEPFQRSPNPAELTALRKWMDGGGSVLYFAQGTPRPLDPKDPIAGDIALTAPAVPPVQTPATDESAEGNGDSRKSSDPLVTAEAEAMNTPFTRDVEAVSGTATLRLVPAPNAAYDVLFRDMGGILIAHKKVGRGHLIMASLNLLTNNGVRQADNAVFLVNVAQVCLADSNRAVAFDEYHHGIGFAAGSDEGGAGLVASVPRAFWLSCLPLMAAGLFWIYNGNRRFGPIVPGLPVGPPPSTDYIGSMARLFRRAGASDAALLTLCDRFTAELARSLFVPLETPPDTLAALAAKQYGVDGSALLAILSRCQAVRHGSPLPESELLPLARQLEQLRRKCNLVGN